MHCHCQQMMTWNPVQGTDEQKAQGRKVLTEVLEAIRIVAVLLSPVTPTIARSIYLQLGFPEEKAASLHVKDAQWGGTPAKPAINLPPIKSLHCPQCCAEGQPELVSSW